MSDQGEQEFHVTIDLARTIVAEQFPEWVGLALRAVDASGHDNATYRLGDTMLVKFPTAQRYVANLAAEAAAMAEMASSLAAPIPRPLAGGEPRHGYPWPWRVQSWVPGQPIHQGNLGQSGAFGAELAGFLCSLHRAPRTTGKAPGDHNFHRGGDLNVYDAQTREAVAALAGRIDTASALTIWEAATATQWTAEPVWVHGDFAPGNILSDNGALAGVIDFGQCCVGDPACDLVIAWTYLNAGARDTFVESMKLDADTWDRARGWALWKALILTWWNAGSDDYSVANAPRVLQEVLTHRLA